MARVTSVQVQEIMPDLPASLIEDSNSLDTWVDTASHLVDDVLAILSGSAAMSDARLADIELFLAAHFVAISYMKTAGEKAGSVSETFQYRVGLNFNVTVYGQQALILDTSGSLASLQAAAQKGKTRLRFKWLGDPDDLEGIV